MVAITVHEGEEVGGVLDLLPLCQILFPGFQPGELQGRLGWAPDPALVAARDGEGALVGFKLGYRQGTDVFYSWLGGVHPDARRQGIAAALMRHQHDWAKGRGYRFVETRTRAANRAMIILNLQAGFTITGLEVGGAGHAVVTQRLALG